MQEIYKVVHRSFSKVPIFGTPWSIWFHGHRRYRPHRYLRIMVQILEATRDITHPVIVHSKKYHKKNKFKNFFNTIFSLFFTFSYPYTLKKQN